MDGRLDRRQVLAGMAGAAIVAALPLPGMAAGQEGGVSLARFLRASAVLTGQYALDPVIGRNIRSLLATDADAGARIDRLVRAVEDLQHENPGNPSALLDSDRFRQEDLGAVAKEVVRGWYVGIVGPDEAPTFVTYSDALMYRAVLDVHNVPSFCGGVPHFWAEPPGDYANPFVEG